MEVVWRKQHQKEDKSCGLTQWKRGKEIHGGTTEQRCSKGKVRLPSTTSSRKPFRHGSRNGIYASRHISSPSENSSYRHTPRYLVRTKAIRGRQNALKVRADKRQQRHPDSAQRKAVSLTTKEAMALSIQEHHRRAGTVSRLVAHTRHTLYLARTTIPLPSGTDSSSCPNVKHERASSVQDATSVSSLTQDFDRLDSGAQLGSHSSTLWPNRSPATRLTHGFSLWLSQRLCQVQHETNFSAVLMRPKIVRSCSYSTS